MTRFAVALSLAAGLFAASAGVSAQTASTSPSSPAKKELVAKVMKLQQPGIDGVARQLVQQPAAQMMQQAGIALQQRVAADRREAVARDIQADMRKYVEEVEPTAREKAGKLAPAILGPILEEKFSEDELRQLITIIESPVNRKYQALGGEMQRALAEKLVAEMRPTMEIKLRALQQTVAARLQPAASAPAGK
ncbi:MAG: hypothetical protein IPL57_08565 [Rubrivivax sp.]|nr:hypothetical protein [Rubrivivax sp.]